MGYEIPGGLGVKMADPSREVYVICGDASYLMLPSDIITSIQEGYKITIILINNEGYASIGGLSQSVGGEGFGTHFKYRNKKTGELDGDFLPVDLAKNAEFRCCVIKAEGIDEFNNALLEAKKMIKQLLFMLKPLEIESCLDMFMPGGKYLSQRFQIPGRSAKPEKIMRKTKIKTT